MSATSSAPATPPVGSAGSAANGADARGDMFRDLKVRASIAPSASLSNVSNGRVVSTGNGSVPPPLRQTSASALHQSSGGTPSSPAPAIARANSTVSAQSVLNPSPAMVARRDVPAGTHRIMHRSVSSASYTSQSSVDAAAIHRQAQSRLSLAPSQTGGRGGVSNGSAGHAMVASPSMAWSGPSGDLLSNDMMRSSQLASAGIESFPLLSRPARLDSGGGGHSAVSQDLQGLAVHDAAAAHRLTEELRLQRYHQLRKGLDVFSLSNDPLATYEPADDPDSQSASAAATDPPGLSDAEIDVESLRRYMRMVGPLTAQYRHGANDDDAAFTSPASRARRSAGVRAAGVLSAEQDAERELVRCLEVVPDLYFRGDFALLAKGHLEDLASSDDAEVHLFELPTYLDLVEINLGKQINARSQSFFSALLSIQDLYREVSQGIRSIQHIRKDFGIVHHNYVDAGATVLQAKRRLANLRKLNHKVHQVQAVVSAQQQIKGLMSNGQFALALELIHSSRRLLQSELQGVECLRHADTKLKEMLGLTEKLMANEFVQVALYGSAAALATAASSTASVERQLEKIEATVGVGLPMSRSTSAEKTLGLAAQSSTASGKHKSAGKVDKEIKVVRDLERDRQKREQLAELSAEDVHLINGLVSNMGRLGTLAMFVHPYREQVRSALMKLLKALVASSLAEPTMQPLPQAAAPPPSLTVSGVSSAGTPASSPSHSGGAAATSGATATGGMGSSSTLPISPPASTVLSSSTQPVASASPVHSALAGLPSTVPALTSSSSASQKSSTSSSPTPVTADSKATEPAVAAPATTSVGGTLVSDHIRALTHRQFMQLLDNLYSGALCHLRRMAAVYHAAVAASARQSSTDTVVPSSSPSQRSASDDGKASSALEVTGSALRESSSLSSLAIASEHELGVLRQQFSRDLFDVVFGMVDFVHKQLATVVALREKAHASLEFPQMRELLEQSLTFVTRSEALVNKTAWPLRGQLLAHAKTFLESFHASNKRKLVELLNNEQWQRCPIPRDYQLLIDAGFEKRSPILLARSGAHSSGSDDAAANGSAAAAGAAASPRSPVASPRSNDSNNANSGSAEQQPQPPPPTEARVLFVAASVTPGTSAEAKAAAPRSRGIFDKYAVCPSVLSLLEQVALYLECAAYLQPVGATFAGEAAMKLLDLLRTFNSRTSQLVLGAGAMHTARLKSITAKHLALSSQCLGLVVSQLPNIRKAFAAKIPEKQHALLVDLDTKIPSDYLYHQREIHTKLVHIVRDLGEFCCKTLLKCPWAVSATVLAIAAGSAWETKDSSGPATSISGAGAGSGSSSGAQGGAGGPNMKDKASRMLDSIVQAASAIGEKKSVADREREKEREREREKERDRAFAALTAASTEVPKVENAVKDLMKQTASLHHTLTDLLPAHQRDEIFGRIAVAFGQTFGKHMRSLALANMHVAACVSINISFLVKRLRALDGLAETAGSELEDLITPAHALPPPSSVSDVNNAGS